MSDTQLELADLDPFDLPDWLGTAEVTWAPAPGTGFGVGAGAGAHLPGALHGACPDRAAAGESLACDLWAIDEAFPRPVTDDATRARAHQAWQHGQVLVGLSGTTLVVAVPGTGIGAEAALETITRFARAVGAEPERYSVLLRVAP